MKENKRVIKFRGYSKKNNKWVYGMLLKPEDKIDEYVIVKSFYSDTLAMECFFVPAESVGEFTGLLDKQGKEIYEGDLAKYKLENEEGELVEYIEEIQYEGSGFTLDGNVPLDAFVSEVEIIGNVYEHPELLTPPTSKP